MSPQKRITLKWMLTFVILAGLMVTTIADKSGSEERSPKLKQPTSPAPTTTGLPSSPRDEIYIDDESVEGSGGRSEIHDDLEKDADYSGSGFGPDDEDSSTSHHISSSNTNQKNRQTLIDGGSSSGGGINNRQDTTNRNKDQQTRVNAYDLDQSGNNNNNIVGSGDGDDDDDNDNDDDDGDDDFEHGIIDNDDNTDNTHTDKIDHDVSRIDPYEKHDDNTKDFIDVDNDKQKIDDTTDKDDDDNDDDHDIYTDVTDISESDETYDSSDSKDKISNEFGSTDLDHRNSGADLDTNNNEVLIMNTKAEDRTTSFFAQPGILAAVIGGAVVGLLCAILVVMFIVYRMRKKDEGSYALDEPKRSPAVNSYAKNGNNREFYA